MIYKLNKLDKFILKRIFKKALIQGSHRNNLIEIYILINDTTKNEFTEDNTPALHCFLTECFDNAILK